MLKKTSKHICLFSLALMAACSGRELGAPTTFASDFHSYFPLKTGKYIDYKVDSIVYDFEAGGIVQDTARFFLREQIGDTLTDNNGNTLYRIERFTRKDSTESWQIQDIWTASRTETQAFRTEENLRFNPLVFPSTPGKRWNGNAAFDEFTEIAVAGEQIRPWTNWSYRIESTDQPGEIGPMRFDSLTVVMEADDDNLIERRFSKAIYARNLGLVYKKQLILDSQYCNQNPPPADCTTLPWEVKAEKGYILTLEIIGHN